MKCHQEEIQQPRKQNPQVLMKTPEIPMWVKDMKFEYFKTQIVAWNKDNPETDKN